jgi:probable addiction module antidote protein
MKYEIITTAFNPFNYMETQAEIDAYLLECFNDENPNLFVNALGHLAKYHSMTEVAKATSINRKAFNGKTQPKWDTYSSFNESSPCRLNCCSLIR